MIGKIEKRNRTIYMVYLGLLLGCFAYANLTGWRIYSTDSVEHYEPGKAGRNARVHSHYGGRFFHK